MGGVKRTRVQIGFVGEVLAKPTPAAQATLPKK